MCSLKFYRNESTAFFVWLLLFNTIILRFIHVIACFINSFLFINSYSINWLYYDVSVRLLMCIWVVSSLELLKTNRLWISFYILSHLMKNHRCLQWNDRIVYTTVTILQWNSNTNYLRHSTQVKSTDSNKTILPSLQMPAASLGIP
jgi:hypothetical protein